jgi:cytochrome d ubiquinol oxidase subunit I
LDALLLSPLFLSRIQFGFVISFHILFPAFTIGLAHWLAFVEWRWLRTRDDLWRDIYFFWLKIFAVSFGMGVVSGIVMSFQFGTNWAVLSERAGNILGPLLSYEVLTAFFLEATFLGVMLFGWKRVSDGLHFFATCMVALGTLISTFWIISANSWMQTPAGHEWKDGVAIPVDWLRIVFNPSFPYRFAHMLNAAYLTAGFVVIAVGARYLLGGRYLTEGRTMLRMGIGLMAILAPLQLFIGDQHGLNTLEHQPIKIAAMEAHWDGSKPGDFHIFAWPDEKAGVNHFELSIPRGASLILTHRMNGLFPGLLSVPEADRPPVKIVFFAFRIMLGLGMFMIAAALFGVFLWWRRSLFETRWFLHVLAQSWWVGFVAVIAGWVVTESGRQPWVVHGLMRTADATSPVPGATIAGTLALFVLAYGVVFSFGIYYINRLIAKGPDTVESGGSDALANRPIGAAKL